MTTTTHISCEHGEPIEDVGLLARVHLLKLWRRLAGLVIATSLLASIAYVACDLTYKRGQS
jgi:hypothetical protein